MKKSESTRVLIVDDHPTVCEGLSVRINAQADMKVCGEASDVKEALKKTAETNPDVAIVDISLRNSDGLELVKSLKSRHKQVRTVVHSMFDENVYAERCLHAGALAYVNKEANPNAVIEAIRTVRHGRIYLSPTMANVMLGRAAGAADRQLDLIDTLTDRQLEVFRLIGEGKSAQQIADRLHVSIHTVESHRENIKRKLNIANMTELTCRAVLWAADNR